MIQGVPVIAIDNAGPKETVLHEKTGFLLENDAEQWSQKMIWMVEEQGELKQMKLNCVERMLQNFEF